MLRERNRQSAAGREKGLGHRPFVGLGPLLQTASEKPAPRRIREPKTAPTRADGRTGGESFADEADLFLREVDDVKPLDRRQRQRVAVPPPARPPRAMVSEKAEALAQLADLVTGKAPFDISDADEYIEGSVKGLDPRVVGRLRRGEFAHQAHLDLHGMTSEEARTAVDRFLLDAYRGGRRCVLLIHGRGLNSRDQIPVLKNRVTAWLARGQWSRLVLAFTSARRCDGGLGALYVLLRRHRASKRELHVVAGSKS
jgi:DNA-nicking Smr family endonuclease